MLILSVNKAMRADIQINRNNERIAELTKLQNDKEIEIKRLKEIEVLLLDQVEDLQKDKHELDLKLSDLDKEYNDLKEKYKKNKILRQQELKTRMTENNINPAEVLVRTDNAEIGLLNIFLSYASALSKINFQTSLIMNLSSSINTWRGLYQNKSLQYDALNDSFKMETDKFLLQTENFNAAKKQIKWHKLKEKIGGGIIILLVVLNLLK